MAESFTNVPDSPASATVPSTHEKAPMTVTANAEDSKIILVPKPSDDPRDPLNWPLSRKVVVAFALCFALFTGFSGPFNGQIQIAQQAKLYGKTTVEITYFNSAASGGLLAGCWFWWPISKKIGRSATIFWCLIGTLITQIWSCYMRAPDQYDAFMASKFCAGFFGNAVSVLGPLYLVDLFFLHQRGRAFNFLGIAMNLGASAGPTFSGFITVHLPWYNEYWWTIGLCCAAIVFVFLFLEETSWDRVDGAENIILHDPWFKRKVKTFFPGTKVVPRASRKEMIDSIVVPIKLAVNPILLLVAGFDAISFGFWVALNSLTPVWLQKPVKAGGYGFSVLDNAAFTTVHWMTLIASQIYGHLISDRIPLWLCRRNGGIWRPELRLHALWFPNFFLAPLGLGFVGIAMQYKLHWILMAIGNFLVTFGAMQGIPVTMNYVAECFRMNTTEATIPLTSFRLLLGLTINFYINYWIAAVGVGWVYGMMAFFSVFAFFFVIVLMWKGHEIRGASPFVNSSSEEGEVIYKQKLEPAALG
ncbi:hypothetical protein VM1G_01242 [Cytospora mali]|uniref:Major facilitator superfamily (MFS) profile domain-containing protein n=1 Tax=Cytospora mali TaxID=578113 RepID=A0A194VKX1_CYTMA|nr:hypothetical protein VM1G_01242 [Valsa mali]